MVPFSSLVMRHFSEKYNDKLPQRKYGSSSQKASHQRTSITLPKLKTLENVYLQYTIIGY